jgi:hypothetical protein
MLRHSGSVIIATTVNRVTGALPPPLNLRRGGAHDQARALLLFLPTGRDPGCRRVPYRDRDANPCAASERLRRALRPGLRHLWRHRGSLRPGARLPIIRAIRRPEAPPADRAGPRARPTAPGISAKTAELKPRSFSAAKAAEALEPVARLDGQQIDEVASLGATEEREQLVDRELLATEGGRGPSGLGREEAGIGCQVELRAIVVALDDEASKLGFTCSRWTVRPASPNARSTAGTSRSTASAVRPPATDDELDGKAGLRPSGKEKIVGPEGVIASAGGRPSARTRR